MQKDFNEDYKMGGTSPHQKARDDCDPLIYGDTNKLWSALKGMLLSQLQHEVQIFSQGKCMWAHGMGGIESYKVCGI